jgi:8-hydroxy-5-deazaflavin:NADPH oxidoreductase
MTIAIIGAGHVGQALARALVAEGQAAAFGVPEPRKYAGLAAQFGAGVTLGRVSGAAAPAEIAILATPYAAALQVARDVPDCGQRILVDATAPIAPEMAGLPVGTKPSGAE